MASIPISGNGFVTVDAEEYEVGYALKRNTGAAGVCIVGTLKGEPRDLAIIAKAGKGLLTLETGRKSEIVLPHLDYGSSTMPVAVCGPFQ